MATLRPNDVLAGKYRVERVLGSGGMGYVVAARHLQLDQLVALKFLKTDAKDNTEATARFLREAKACVKLKNEHVARVFDVGTMDGGEPYMVMEYLDGEDLSALSRRRGALPVGEAIDYVLQACEALADAHSLGIIHRDVKLANLFVTHGPTGEALVKVLDFGISKMNPFGESELDMTRTTSMLGSPRFMSPEQMKDPRAVDARSDVWSLGVVLYRLITAKAPFEAETLGRLLAMVMHESPDPIATHRQDVPAQLDAAIMHCLDKEPSGRFANVAELAWAILPYASSPARGRALCDRIANTLSIQTAAKATSLLPGAPPSGSSLFDSGTGSPWSGPHPEGELPAVPPAHRSSSIMAAVGLVGLLLAAGIFAKVRADHMAAHANEPPVAPTAVAMGVATPVTAPAPTVYPTVTASPATERVTFEIPATSGGSSAPAVGSAPAVLAAASGTASGKATLAHPSSTTAAAHRNPKEPKPAGAPAAAGAPPMNDGIPATRD